MRFFENGQHPFNDERVRTSAATKVARNISQINPAVDEDVQTLREFWDGAGGEGLRLLTWPVGSPTLQRQIATAPRLIVSDTDDPQAPKGNGNAMSEPQDNSHSRIKRAASEARGGEIILDTKARRLVFISGLVALVVLAIFGAVLG